jgi:hypothetical protein
MKEQELHDKLVKFFEGIKKVKEVLHVIELPNKYGDNVSSFTVKHSYKDKYNYTNFDFTIEWYRNVLFIRNVSYFPFKDYNELRNLIFKYFN